MANVQRLTKRVKDLEEWTKENEMTGGPQGILDTFVFLVNETRMSMQMRTQINQQVQNLRALAFEFIEQHELTEEWNDFLKEKEENAVQEQSPEEVPSLTEAEDGEEVGKEDSEGSETSKESKDEPKEEIKD
jgi:hypothetical protein